MPHCLMGMKMVSLWRAEFKYNPKIKVEKMLKLILDLEPGITEFLDSLRCNLDRITMPPRCFIGFRLPRVEASQRYQFLHPLAK